MRKISIVELEELCKANHCTAYSITHDESSSLDFTVSFSAIDVYYNTITFRSNGYYLALKDITSVYIDDKSPKNILRFFVNCTEYIPSENVKAFIISARIS